MKLSSIYLISLFLILFQCTSFDTKPVLKRQNISILEVADETFPDIDVDYRSEIPVPIAFPKLDQEKIIAVLGNLKFKKKHMWGDTTAPVYARRELPELATQILAAISSHKEGHRLVIISRYDPDESVLSRLHLNSALFWVDEAGLNLVFGVIHEALPRDDFFNDKDWAEILPISLKQSYRDLSLKPADFFTYKKIQGLRHMTWAIVPTSKLATLKYEQPVEKKNRIISKKSNTIIKKSPIERLKKLKEAHAAELINDEEYTQQRKMILKDF